MTKRDAQAGVTLAELMVAMALIGIGILGCIAAFNLISRSISNSKGSTLATNLAQEKMQILMQKSYFEILVSSSPTYLNTFSPSLPYDSSYFPPEKILQGSIWFTRYTYVQVVQDNNGVLQTLSPSTPDTGMRQITVYVVWNSPTGMHYVTLQNVINNPSTVMSDVIVQGNVTDATTGALLKSALVDVAENVGWRDNTNAAGHYLLHMSPGNFHLAASLLGYYPAELYIGVAPNLGYTQNIPLTPISSGTVQGTAWLDNHLVISQVVASTGSANDYEYIELFNPTTSSIYIGDNNNTNSPSVVPIIWGNTNSSYNLRHMVYVSSAVPSHGYYLIANTGYPPFPNTTATYCSTITVSGITFQPDACWELVTYPRHALECGANCNGGAVAIAPDAGGVSLGSANSYTGNLTFLPANWPAAKIDSFGWSATALADAAPSNAVEGTPNAINGGGVAGLAAGEQYVRMSQACGLSIGYGRAYDTDNNAVNFYDWIPVSYPPYNSSIVQTVVSGTPANGAIVSVTDGLSSSSSATLSGYCPTAQFSVPGVATGTWSVFIDSKSASAEIDSVTVTAGAITQIPNANTLPPWVLFGIYSTFLTTSGVNGMISGSVTDIVGNPIAFPGVLVGLQGQTYPVNSVTGRYSVRLAPGTYDVTANPNLGNAAYETQVQPSVTIPNIGDVTDNISFQLAAGGKLSGWVTRDGINPLPGVTVTATDINGISHDSEVSANNGYFTLINLTTGPYYVQPILDPKEISIPNTSSSTVVAGTNVFVGSYTVVGAMGTVTGTVTSKGIPIQSGVLIVISTMTIGLPPPAISSNTLTGAAFYEGSSQEDGTYSLQVRGSTTTTYNVDGFYVTLNGQIPVTSTKTITNVTVTAGQTTSGKNFAW